jgi:hypothetical protein
LPVNKPVLFLDDEYVASRTGLAHRLGQLEKWPDNPILRPERPWEGKSIILWGSVLFDPADDLCKIWYEAYDWSPRRGLAARRTVLCYAESQDGIHFQRPSLGIYPFAGSTDNNIVYTPPPGTVGGRGVIFDTPTVVLDPFDPPPEQRFKMVLFRSDVKAYVRFASPDGIHWRELGPVLPGGGYRDRNSLMADVDSGQWVLYYKGPGNIRTVYMMTSPDFEHWTDHGCVLEPSPEDPPETHFYGMVGFRDQGWGLGFLEMYHLLTENLDTQLLRLGADGRPQRCMPEHTFLERGRWGEWDFTWSFPGNCAPMRFGEELRVYYGGRSVLHRDRPPADIGNISAIGLARLRPEGYACLEAGPSGGILTTVPLEVNGDSCWINADAAGGQVRVELLNPAGEPLNGFTSADCWPLHEDATYFKLNWNRQSSLEPLMGQVVRLRFHLSNARLYSFRFEDQRPLS